MRYLTLAVLLAAMAASGHSQSINLPPSTVGRTVCELPELYTAHQCIEAMQYEIAALEKQVQTQQEENTRLWAWIFQQEKRIAELEQRVGPKPEPLPKGCRLPISFSEYFTYGQCVPSEGELAHDEAAAN